MLFPNRSLLTFLSTSVELQGLAGDGRPGESVQHPLAGLDPHIPPQLRVIQSWFTGAARWAYSYGSGTVGPAAGIPRPGS